MKLLFIAVLLFTPTLAKAWDLQFHYAPNESGEETPCTHKQIRDLPDWRVQCGNKEYTAHVVVHQIKREVVPHTSFEVLYWITDPNAEGNGKRQYHSVSAWVHLTQKTGMHSISLAQGVENDYASLVLDFFAEGKK